MANVIKGLTVEIGGDTTKLTKAMGEVNSKSRNLASELKSVEKALKLDPTNVDLINQKQDLLGQSITNSKDKLNLLNETISQIDSGKVEVTEEQYRYLQREISFTETAIKNLEKQESTSHKTMSENIKDIGDGFTNTGDKIEKVGDKINALSGTAAAALGASIKVASDYENNLAKLSTIYDPEQTSMDELSKQIIDLSNQSGEASSDIAGYAYDAISAGQDTANAVSFVSNATRLSKAGFAETGDALNILTTIMNAYKLEADKVTYVSDMLIQTQNKGKTTVAELSATMGKIIPTAKSYDVALNQVCTGYAKMTANGVATAESTTYMNSMLNELGKSGTKVSDALKSKTGKSFKELMDEGSTLSNTLKIIKDVAEENGKSFNDMWSSSEAAKSGIILLGDSSQEFNDLLAEMSDCTGATSEAYNKLDTSSNKVKKSANELKNVGIELGNEVLEQAQPLIEDISGSVEKLTKFISNLTPKQKETLIKALELVAVLGPMTTVQGKLIKGIGTAVNTVPKFISALKNLKKAQEGAAVAQTALNAAESANPVGAIIELVVILASALVDLSLAIDVFSDDTSAEMSKWQSAMEEKLDNAKGKVDDLKNSYDNFRQSKYNATSDTNSEFQYYKDLWDELQGIVDQNGAIKEGYEDRAKFITEKFSDVTGKEIEINGKVVQSYKDIASEIENVLKLKQGETLLNATQNNYATAVKSINGSAETNGSEKAVAQSKTDYEKVQKELEKYQEILEQAKATQKDLFNKGQYNEAAKFKKQYDEYQTKAEEIKKYVDELKKTYDYQSDLYYEYLQTITQYENLSSSVTSKNYDDIAINLEKFKYNFKSAKDSTESELKEQVNTFKDKLSELKNHSYSTNEEEIKSIEKLLSAAQDELNAFHKQSSENIEISNELAKSSTDDMLNHISEKIVEKAPEIIDHSAELANSAKKVIENTDLTSAGNKQIEQYSNAISNGQGKVVDISKKLGSESVSAVETVDFSPAGNNLVQGFINGIKEKIADVKNTATNVAKTAYNSIKDWLDIHSPSRKTKGLGINTAKGFLVGMETEIPYVEQSAEEVAQSAYDKIKGLTDILGLNSVSPEMQVLRNIKTANVNNGNTTQSKAENQAFTEIAKKIDNVISAVEKSGNNAIYLDGNTLVGSTQKRFDKAFADMSNKYKRGW